MLNVVKEQKGSLVVVFLTGSIEENVDLSQAIGAPAPQMQINCKGVTRINSVGVKAWIKYFQAAQQQGLKFVFSDCSTAIIEQINLISNFTCGGAIDSMFVPFTCTKCKSELVGLFKCDAIKKANFQIPPLKCSKCGGQAIFDDIPEEYFGFLNR